jgi:multidrug efflux pump subunit AcrA (membrane-fusion protein)
MENFKTIFILPNKKILIIFLLVLLWACSQEQTQNDSTRISGTPVLVTQPLYTDITEYIDLNANTLFLKKEIVRATFQGFIEKIYKNIGDEIHAGDLLFDLKTKESATNDNIHLNLGKGMFLGPVSIKAHSEGILTTLNYHNGDFVAEGEEIAIISNPSSLRITLNVPYAYVSRINTGSSCQIFLPDGKTLPAIIQKIIPSVDPVSQTQTFLLRPEQAIHLPEFLNVNARLPLQTSKGASLLPRSAVLSNETQEKFWVMKLINDSTAVRVDVQKGIENDSLIQIVQPVFSSNDRVISDGAFGLPDSAKVFLSE